MKKKLGGGGGGGVQNGENGEQFLFKATFVETKFWDQVLEERFL